MAPCLINHSHWYSFCATIYSPNHKWRQHLMIFHEHFFDERLSQCTSHMTAMWRGW